MPFDPTNFKLPSVTVLPPTPPEEPGRGPRLRVEIEIVDKRQQSPNRSRIGGWLLLGFFLLLAAHAFGAEPRHEWWQDTYTYKDSIGTRWTFPTDQRAGEGGGHGCTTIRGGDGFDRTSCW